VSGDGGVRGLQTGWSGTMDRYATLECAARPRDAVRKKHNTTCLDAASRPCAHDQMVVYRNSSVQGGSDGARGRTNSLLALMKKPYPARSRCSIGLRSNSFGESRSRRPPRPRSGKTLVSAQLKISRKPTNSALFARHPEISVCMELRGGAGRTRTSNQTIINC